MRWSLKGRSVIITGASSGIGAAAAQAFAGAGAKLVLAARRFDRLESLAVRLETEALPIACDVTREADVQAVFERTIDRFGRVDVLVNNAGVGLLEPIASTSAAHWQRLLAVNLTGTFYGIKHAIEPMRASGGGRILNVASWAGLRAVPWMSAYSAAKFAVVGLSEAARIELEPYNIRVCAICPPRVSTEFFQVMHRDSRFQAAAAGPVLRPRRVARVIVRTARRPRAVVSIGIPAKTALWVDKWCRPLVDWGMRRYRREVFGGD